VRRPRSLISALISVALAVAGAVALTFAAAPSAAALDNGLAQTPPMGFNDWNAFGCNVDEQLI
jgi:alpha-galactosidase